MRRRAEPRRRRLSAPPIRAARPGRLDAVRPLTGAARIDAMLARVDALDGADTFDEPGVLVAAGCGTRDCFDGHATATAARHRDTRRLTALGSDLAFAAFVAWAAAVAGR